MSKKIVVSLCDGMSCGAVALDRLGLMDKDVEYHAFEIDKYAEAVSRMNYPEIIRHGDARNYTKLIGNDVFLLMGGFPCQPYSVAGQGKGDNDERDLSTLIVDALRDLKPKYFLFENVPMKQEHQDRISAELGVEPVLINSQDFSAHHRKRLYWTNIPIAPYEDKGIVLSDIIEDGMVDRDKSYCVDANYFKGGSMKMYYEKARRQVVFDTNNYRRVDRKWYYKGCHQVGEADLKGYDIIKRVYSTSGKAPALTTMQGGHREPKINTDELHWRALTPKECERLQTVPDYYTNYGLFEEGGSFTPISNSQRYKMLGNGWTVDVIQHIMEGMDI